MGQFSVGTNNLARQNLAGIQRAEQNFSEDQNRRVALSIFQAAIQFDRTSEGLGVMETVIRKMTDEAEADNPPPKMETISGLVLGYRMISGASLLSRVDSACWMEVSLEFAYLEGPLVGFLERHETKPWAVAYYQDVNFERYRKEINGR